MTLFILSKVQTKCKNSWPSSCRPSFESSPRKPWSKINNYCQTVIDIVFTKHSDSYIYWCSKTIQQRQCRCPKQILWDFFSHVNTLFVQYICLAVQATRLKSFNVFVFLNFSFCFIIIFVIIFFTQFCIFWTLHNYVHLAGVKLQTGIRLLLTFNPRSHLGYDFCKLVDGTHSIMILEKDKTSQVYRLLLTTLRVRRPRLRTTESLIRRN